MRQALSPGLLAMYPPEDHLMGAMMTSQEIASAKAGIFKEGRPALVARQPEPEAQATLEDCAQSAGCPVLTPEQTLKLQVSCWISGCQSALRIMSDGCYSWSTTVGRLQAIKSLVSKVM